MSSLKKYLPYFVLAPVVVPLVIWPGGLLYPYLVVKTLGFYALMLATFAAFALMLALGLELHTGRLKHKMTWIPGALTVLAYVASLAGLNFYRSFWSIFARGDGLLELTLVVASFYLIVLTADQYFLKRLVSAVAWVGSAVALYGVIEWLLTGGRIESTIGNAALVAGYLALALFSTLAATEFYKGGTRTALYYAAGLETLAIVLTATRGTILALGVALVIACVYCAKKKTGALRSWSAGLLIAMVLLGSGGYLLRGELAKLPFAPVARVAQISTSDPDIASRLFIWGNMTHAILQHPLLGMGAEHIDYLFNQFYDPSKIGEEWFDRSHNAFLDYAAQYGIFGLLLYSALIASFILLAVRSKSRSGFFLALGGVAYAVHQFFVFDSISSWWLFLALYGALCAGLAGSTVRYKIPDSAGYALAVVFAALIIPVSILPLIANYDIAQAYLYHRIDVGKTDQYLALALALHTYADLEAGYEIDDMYVNGQAPTLTGASLATAYAEASSLLQKNFARYPYDARTALYLADVESLAPAGQGPTKSDTSALAQEVIKLSPERSAAWYILVNVALSSANANPAGSAARTAGYQQGFALLKQYEAMVPMLSEPHYVLAQLYQALGDAKDSASEAALGKADYKPDLATAKRAASYYENLQDWPDSLFFLESIVALDSSDYASLYNEAKVLFLTGDEAGADKIVTGLRLADPAIIATDPAFTAAISHYENSQH